jgi:hypothetical protein
MTLKSPYVWFGGKRRVADLVWRELGDPDNYVEPFAGSLAVLLGRPGEGDWCETVNDADGNVANFWRAIHHDPEAVAHYADWPVNEADLTARHLWLVNEGASRLSRMFGDPDFYDPKVAGWWVWGINAWIGSGWCSGKGPWVQGDDGGLVKRDGTQGQGVNRKLPHLGDRGKGVNRQLPHLGNRGTDKPGKETDLSALAAYFNQLAHRMRGVRVCCGDWSRVVTNGATSYGATVGVFLDPPYLGDVRTHDLYTVDDHDIAHAVRDWCLEYGDNPRFRIVLAGYADEHDHLLPPTWRRHYYSASACYQTAGNKGGVNSSNRHNEVLWYSPHCVGAAGNGGLFSGEEPCA